MTQHEFPGDGGFRRPERNLDAAPVHKGRDVIQSPDAEGLDPEFAPRPLRVRHVLIIGGLVTTGCLAAHIFGGSETPDASNVSGGNIPATASANPGASPEAGSAMSNSELRHRLVSRYNSCSVITVEDRQTNEIIGDNPEPLDRVSLNMGFDPDLQSENLRKQYLGKGDVTVNEPLVYGASFASIEDTRGQHLDALATSTVADPTHVDLLVPVDTPKDTVIAVYVEQEATTTDHGESTTRDDLCSGMLQYDATTGKWQLGDPQSLPALEPYTIYDMPGN